MVKDLSDSRAGCAGEGRLSVGVSVSGKGRSWHPGPPQLGLRPSQLGQLRPSAALQLCFQPLHSTPLLSTSSSLSPTARLDSQSICPHPQQVCVTAADQVEGFCFALLMK